MKRLRYSLILLLGCLLFNYPLLALFNRDELFAGVPLLFVYAYAAWVLLIALLALIVERR